MMDKYGNYFWQELLLSCSSDQRIRILDSIENSISDISKNKKGTHTIQKMIGLVNLDKEEIKFSDMLTGSIGELCIHS